MAVVANYVYLVMAMVTPGVFHVPALDKRDVLLVMAEDMIFTIIDASGVVAAGLKIALLVMGTVKLTVILAVEAVFKIAFRV